MQGMVLLHLPCGLTATWPSSLPHFCVHAASSKFNTLTEFERARGLTPENSSIYHHPHDLTRDPDSFADYRQKRPTLMVAVYVYETAMP